MSAPRGQALPAEVHLLWIPLGAGGTGYVRLNGRVYEAIAARVEGRPRCDLYHTALEVTLPEGRFTIEIAWPSPDTDTASRGVVVEGPVGHRRIGGFRLFRYEVRCWRNGTIPDAAHAVAGPRLLRADEGTARRVVESAVSVPALTWGRDERRTGDMWNSNSVISWLLVKSGIPVEDLRPPPGGRAPGWRAGIAVALASP